MKAESEVPMNIAMLSVHSCPLGRLGEKNTGGMSVYIRELARELGRQGHRIDVYTRAHGPVHDQIIEFGPNARVVHLQAGRDEEVDKLSIYPHLSDFVSDLERFRATHHLHYDLIHSHYWLSGWAGRQIQQVWNVGHVTTFHTVAAVKNAIGIGEPEPHLRLDAEKSLVKGCHCIIASSARERRHLIDYYHAPPRLIRVVPCGVNLGLFRPIDKKIASPYLDGDGRKVVLYVGRINPLKGVDQLLRAMALLDQQKIKLVIVGGGEQSRSEMNRLKDLSERLQIQDLVIFQGLVKQELLPYYYSAADVCVVPSYYESFGLVTLESLACGTPVVVTKVGCVEHIIRHGKTGYLVADNRPGDLAGAIGRLLFQSGEKRVPTASIRESVMDFSWRNMARATEREYRSVFMAQSLWSPPCSKQLEVSSQPS